MRSSNDNVLKFTHVNVVDLLIGKHESGSFIRNKARLMGMVNVSELLINIESNDELKKLISESQNGMHGTIQV
ncbi:TPA: hypothetical protein K0O28_002958 [Legionella pneumophila]|uniref:hypothetical protein n=1 Tax=Legionella pneumophila TaxID=446 RepID=UPI0004835B11|nr:hypothetical protein [Legionella pneumophila]AOU04143.1 hypothetical protein A9E97_05335 [Legionella pneumophila]AOU07106.1 hypothetical protein A9E98_05345 [Legionella pneumophila]AOU10108.1 hypothetical protein A9F03_05530 [Legionella pneumophila]AOU13031.1 hypothetical protein A9E99_05350 [Legionella pneumophila]AOU16032.1 hypothetical protein A9F00_05530 [Legionella pneumophila]